MGEEMRRQASFLLKLAYCGLQLTFSISISYICSLANIKETVSEEKGK